MPTNTSGQPGVYLRRQIVRRNGNEYEYLHWQAQSPAGAKPWRSRSFSVDRFTRMTLLVKLNNASADEVRRAFLARLRKLPLSTPDHFSPIPPE